MRNAELGVETGIWLGGESINRGLGRELMTRQYGLGKSDKDSRGTWGKWFAWGKS